MDSKIASWIFGSILLAFILGVFIFAPSTLPPFKQRLLGVLCALLAGFFTFFFTGTLGVNIGGSAGRFGQISVQAVGGIAAFVLMLWWWLSGSAPIKVSGEEEDVPIKIKTQPRPKNTTPKPRGKSR